MNLKFLPHSLEIIIVKYLNELIYEDIVRNHKKKFKFVIYDIEYNVVVLRTKFNEFHKIYWMLRENNVDFDEHLINACNHKYSCYSNEGELYLFDD